MIVIDKTKENQRLIVTVSENTTDSEANYQLNVHSPFTNKSYSLNLPANTSTYPDRYDEFILDTSFFNDWENGSYDYSIKEINAGVVEIGSLQVMDETTTSSFVSITPEEDDWVVYQN